MTITAEKLAKLATSKPYQFLVEFAKLCSVEDVTETNERWGSEGQTVTPEEMIEDEYRDNYVAYLNGECLGREQFGLTLREVESVGGGEGGGERVVRVWAVVQGAKKVTPTAKNKYAQFEGGEVISHIRATGYYQSYEGTTFDDEAEFVFPKEVTVVKFYNAKELKKVNA